MTEKTAPELAAEVAEELRRLRLQVFTSRKALERYTDEEAWSLDVESRGVHHAFIGPEVAERALRLMDAPNVLWTRMRNDISMYQSSREACGICACKPDALMWDGRDGYLCERCLSGE